MATEKQIGLYKKLSKEAGLTGDMAGFEALENGDASERIEELITAAQAKRTTKAKKSVKKSADSNGSQLGSCVKLVMAKWDIFPLTAEQWTAFDANVKALYDAVDRIKAEINKPGAD